MAQARKIVVAVDFGTTFSGVAWALSDEPDEIHHISRWPGTSGQGSRSSGKVPTTLLYPGAGNTGIQWGFQIPPGSPSDQVLRYFKLMLEPNADNIAFVGANQAYQTHAHVDQVITDYLTSLGTFFLRHLDDQYGADLVAASELVYVLTVPAIWSGPATERTLTAFRRALSLPANHAIEVVSEPEAAATCFLQRNSTEDIASSFRVNDCFMIVDAGGGTVDLISYTIRNVNPLVVEELVPGSGDVCGGVTVTSRFRAWARSRLRGETDYTEDILQGAVDWFDDQIKAQVTSATLASNQSFRLLVRGLRDNAAIGLGNERMEIPAGDMVTFFQPSFTRIKMLVSEQLAASGLPITSIILVGGYGQSQYLLEELQSDALIQQRGIQVWRPAGAWTAVVEGAVMKGMATSLASLRAPRLRVAARRSRRHLGTELTTTYREPEHFSLIGQRRVDGFYGGFEVDTMKWFIRKNDPIPEGQPYLESFFLTTRVSYGRPQRIFLVIYTDEVSDVAPLARAENVRELCNVEADLSRIPENQLAQSRGHDGFMYYHLHGQIEVVYGSMTAMYTLIYNGQRYNTVTAEFL